MSENIISQETSGGMLYLCATPIGNLEDITLRVLRILKEADLIAAEDTRNSIKLLNHFDIHTPLTSYHEYNKREKGKELVEKMRQGLKVALVTDAGTPGISDPGEDLVRMCIEEGIEVTSLPGPAACITALTLSGLPTRRFAFEAFLPMEKKQRARILEDLRQERRTLILYEAPHRLLRTLKELLEVLGNRPAVLCRELTKRHETAFRSNLEELVEHYSAHKPLGECVLLVKGLDSMQEQEEERQQWRDLPLVDHVTMYEKLGHTRKEAMKLTAEDRGLTRREVYQALLGTVRK